MKHLPLCYLVVNPIATKIHHGVRSEFTVCTTFCDRRSVGLFASHPENNPAIPETSFLQTNPNQDRRPIRNFRAACPCVSKHTSCPSSCPSNPLSSAPPTASLLRWGPPFWPSCISMVYERWREGGVGGQGIGVKYTRQRKHRGRIGQVQRGLGNSWNQSRPRDYCSTEL